MAVTLLGLATFATPLVTTDPKLLGQTQWSPLQVVTAIISGTLPLQPVLPRELLGLDLLLGCGIVYLLLIVIVITILVYPSAKFIGAGAAAGCAVLIGSVLFRYADLQYAIYGAPRAVASGQVNAGAFTLTLSGLLALLIVIAASSDQD
jgi:hypothetical protein